MGDGREVLATLLRHEAKTNTYKFALIRALNDLAPLGTLPTPVRPEPLSSPKGDAA
ncbi:hypothetical protein DAETH_25680 [Deinococcus aetherius]|uniref:Uncharacterized protein n=1 Tax=Deinococcus aetherius TaxID=200252 RepID=A0ABM8AFM0_9DEIO|nr:hypothetical protein [Deinococcus aetherius]BDP42599.1 hypothetical protein DAETH_25680 [Deinococcus aetherius]